MRMWTLSHLCQKPQRMFLPVTAAFVLIVLLFSTVQSANALPAFARKYGLRCSACHESWPALNNFGLKFRDNGYQLMNDRDSPIWQNPSYWPVTFRITPIWHRLSSLQTVDTYPGGVYTANSAVQRVTASGFDLSGLDFHTGGTLEKNISFYVLPSSDPTAAFHFETVMARFDNLMGSSWFNVKVGRFELNNLLSEKRILTLTGNGGIYSTYHFIPVGDGNIWGQMGDNQFGIEYLGHSYDDRTRVSAALLSSNDGNVNLVTGGNGAYSGFFTFDEGIDTGKLGIQRLGAYAFVGQAPIYYLTSGGVPIPGSGQNNKGFTRVGFTGQIYFGPHFDLNVVTQHGSDNAWFGQGFGDAINPSNGSAGTPGLNATPGTVLPAGSRSPIWNGYLFEGRYVVGPQMIFLARYEAERMQQQATPGTASNLGNVNNYTVGYRYNPFMNPRAGMALHGEFNVYHQELTGPTNPVTGAASDTNTSELLFGIDFDF